MPSSKFSIKDIQSITGIKPHTIRIWEKRYGIPKPQRTKTNIRYYFDEDLKLLLNVAILNRNGFRISKITQLEPSELEKLAQECCEKDTACCVQIESLIQVLFKLDEAGFEKILSRNILKIGMQRTMNEVIFPFMQRIGILWQVGSISPAYEHFFSNLVRQKIISATDNLHLQKKDAKTFFMFLPEYESHELCLLYANYLVRLCGHHSVYFGSNMSLAYFKSPDDFLTTDYVVTAITSAIKKEEVSNYIKNLSKSFPNARVLISGQQVTNSNYRSVPKNISIVKTFDELEAFLNSI